MLDISLGDGLTHDSCTWSYSHCGYVVNNLHFAYWPGPLKPFLLDTASTSVDSGLLIFCRKFLLIFSVSMVLSTVLAIAKHCARVSSAFILSNRASLTLEFWLWVRNNNFTFIRVCEATFLGDHFQSPHEITLRLA